MNKVKSPLDNRSDCRIVEEIDTGLIIDGYKKIYNIDVSRFFKEVNKVTIYECNKTKFRFYYPYNLDGDSKFYESLQNFENYYNPWKWEHQVSLKYFKSGDHILEVGSGGNGFVRNISVQGYDITGLELNEHSVYIGKQEGLKIFPDTIQIHADYNFEKYDIVCSYQVLEHISNPWSFLQAKVKALKHGGTMIVCVPNNDSKFLKWNNYPPLNMPPHHMGLWDKNSLEAMGKLLNLEMLSVEYEPLQYYHVDGFTDIVFAKFLPNKYLRFVLRKLGCREILRFFINIYKSSIKGHSILIAYKKK